MVPEHSRCLIIICSFTGGGRGKKGREKDRGGKKDEKSKRGRKGWRKGMKEEKEGTNYQTQLFRCFEHGSSPH